MKYLVYLAGPYTAPSNLEIQNNIAAAETVAREINSLGGSMFAITPHLNTSFMHDIPVPIGYWYESDLALLARCDAILMLPNWENSKGAIAEKEFAEQRDIPVYYYPDLPEVPATVELYPEQCNAFIDIVMNMYRVHIRKNADYGDNLGMTGVMGITVRLADKALRLLSLHGWTWTVTDRRFTGKKIPSNESLEDSFLDAAVYSVLALIIHNGNWRK